MNKRQFRKIIEPFLAFALSILLVQILKFSEFPKRGFPKISNFLNAAQYSISKNFQFSVGDIGYIILITLVVFFTVRIIKFSFQKNTKKIANNLWCLLSIFIFLNLSFHFFWGFNYYKKPISKSLINKNISLDELKYASNYFLKKSIELRELTKENKEGVFTYDGDIKNTELEISKIQHKVMKQYGFLNFTNQIPPNLKPSLFSELLSYMGIYGYFNPFTFESQYNSKMPDTVILFTQFHESSHQWGFGTESEANFVGFLIGVNSENIEFQYVSTYKALRSLLNRIVLYDPEFVKNSLDQYSEKMKKDRKHEIEIQKKYHHAADEAFSVLNDAYLRLNNQEGIESYGKFVELLIGFQRYRASLKG